MSAFLLFAVAATLLFSPEAVKTAFDGKQGAIVVLNDKGETVFCSDARKCAERFPPCSTFKIWNTAIGLELGIVSDPDAPFWKWDGKQYWLPAWNQDQTLRSAFAVSCVPAYQALARKIGAERMGEYLHKISYGDENISSGIDVFWLPAEGRKPLLISPDEQAQLIARLLGGKLPFSPRTVIVLTDIMKTTQTAHGTLYGKTGSGQDASGKSAIGWYVGFVKTEGKTYPFACLLEGKDITGKDARAVVERLFSENGLL